MPASTSSLGKILTALVVLAAAVFAAKVGFPGNSAATEPETNRAEVMEPPPSTPGKGTPAAPSKGPVPATVGGPGTKSTLRVGAWNIEWLGKPEDRSGAAKGVAQSPEDLADLISSSAVSVLALEEIVSRERGTPIRSREIEATIAALAKKDKSRWQYVLFPGRAEGDQLTGVMWNSGDVAAVNVAGKPYDLSTDTPSSLPIEKGRGPQGSALWNRPPHAMKFSAGAGKTDFVVIVLHMKADYNGDFAAHRQLEASRLVDALPWVRTLFKDEDIVLLGDTNCVGEHEPAIGTFEAAGFVDTNAKRAPTHWRGGSMDRLLTPAKQPEFDLPRFEVFSDQYLKKRNLTPKDYKQKFSDHYMVISTIKVIADDD